MRSMVEGYQGRGRGGSRSNGRILRPVSDECAWQANIAMHGAYALDFSHGVAAVSR